MTIYLNSNRLVTYFLRLRYRSCIFAIAIPVCVLLSGCCTGGGSKGFLVEVKAEKNISIAGREMPMKTLSSYMQVRKYPSFAVFTFSCDHGTLHGDLLQVQRILSTLGYYQFRLMTNKGDVPVTFGVVAEQAMSNQPETFSQITITASDIVLNQQSPTIQVIDANTAKIADIISSLQHHNSAVEIVCDFKTRNEILIHIVSTLYAEGYTKIFIASKDAAKNTNSDRLEE